MTTELEVREALRRMNEPAPAQVEKLERTPDDDLFYTKPALPAVCPMCSHGQRIHRDGHGCSVAGCKCELSFVEATPEAVAEVVRANDRG